MLPTLNPTATQATPAPAGKGPSGAKEPAENGGIAFASFLPGGGENIGGPAIMGGAELLAGLRASGSPATPTGKGLPVPANAPQPGNDPEGKIPQLLPPEAQAAGIKGPKTQETQPSGTAGKPQSVANRIDSVALSVVITAVLPEAAKPQQAAAAVPANSSPASGTPKALAPATADPVSKQSVPSLPAAPVRSIPDINSAMADLPRSAALVTKGGKAGAPKPERPATQPQIALKSPEITEQPSAPTPAMAQTSAQPASVSAMQPVAPLAAAPQPATSALAPAMLATAPQPAELPRDFSSLIDRLVQARDAAAPNNPASVRTVLSHADFGAVTVRFDTSGTNLAASFASNDPAFAPAARAALAADAGQRSDDQQRSGQHSQHHAGGQAGGDASGGQESLQSGSRERSAAHSPGKVQGHAAMEPSSDRQGGDASTPVLAPAPQHGLYI